MLIPQPCLYDHSSWTSFCLPFATHETAHHLSDKIQMPFAQPPSQLPLLEAAKGGEELHRQRWSPRSETDMASQAYPSVKRVATTFEYQSSTHGRVVIEDPYNWLEQSATENEEVIAFIDAQSAFTQQYLSRATDFAAVRQVIDTVIDFAHITPATIVGGNEQDRKYYYWSHNGLEPHATMYSATHDQLLEAEKDNYASMPGVGFFDENLMSDDGTVAVGDFYFSSSGKLAAYTVTKSGADLSKVYFRETSKPFIEKPANESIAAEGGPDRLPDVLYNVLFAEICWTNDDKGIFYQRSIGNVDEEPELLYHRLGTQQEQDIVVVGKEGNNTSNLWGSMTTLDGKWLVVTSFNGSSAGSRVYVAPLNQPVSSQMKWLSVVPTSEHLYTFLGNVENTLYFTTDKDAPNQKIVRTTVQPSRAKYAKHVTDLKDTSEFVDVVAEDPIRVLDSAFVVHNDKLLLVYIHNVNHEVYQHELQTGKKVGRLLPDLFASLVQIGSRTDVNEVFMKFSSFTLPTLTYRFTWPIGCSPSTLPMVTQHLQSKIKGVDLDAFETKQVFVPSTKGAQIPVYLVHRKGLPMDGTAAALVHVYGGFDIALMPSFDSYHFAWMAAYDGVLVSVDARGGSEYGEAWHQAGALTNKTNTFDDVIAACQYVVDQKIAAKGKIIVNGASNGGMVSLAVANRAPEGLLGAILAQMPTADLLRFNLFTAGNGWTTELGDPRDPVMFDVLRSYSPLHNVNASKAYPFVLLSTADHDDRVVPMHSFKMIAELQHQLSRNPSPLLMHVSKDAGHGITNSWVKGSEAAAVRICLVALVLGLPRQPLPTSH